MEHIQGALLPTLDDFSESDDSDDDAGAHVVEQTKKNSEQHIFERDGGWDVFSGDRSRPSSRSGSPLRFGRTLAPGSAPPGSSPGTIEDPAAPEVTARWQIEGSTPDVALSGFLEGSRTSDSSFRAMKSSFASQLLQTEPDGRNIDSNAFELSPERTRLKLILPKPVTIPVPVPHHAQLSARSPTRLQRECLDKEHTHRSNKISVSHSNIAELPTVVVDATLASMSSNTRENHKHALSTSNFDIELRSTTSHPSKSKCKPHKAVKRLKNTRKSKRTKQVHQHDQHQERNQMVQNPVVAASSSTGFKAKRYSHEHINDKSSSSGVKNETHEICTKTAVDGTCKSTVENMAHMDKAPAGKSVNLASVDNELRRQEVAAANAAVAERRRRIENQVQELPQTNLFHPQVSFGPAISASSREDDETTRMFASVRFTIGDVDGAYIGALVELLLSEACPVTLSTIAMVTSKNGRRQLLGRVSGGNKLEKALGKLRTLRIPPTGGLETNEREQPVQSLTIGDVVEVEIGNAFSCEELLKNPSPLWNQVDDDKSASPALCNTDTIALIPLSSVRRGKILSTILARAELEQFSITGLRLLFPSAQCLDDPSVTDFLLDQPILCSKGCIVVALSAPRFAVERWHAIVGPADPVLAKRTDPSSLRARLGHSRNDPVLFCSRSTAQTKIELSRWFGPRYDIQKNSNASVSSNGLMCLSRPAVSTAAILIPYKESLGRFGVLMSTLHDLGFTLRGAARLKASKNDLERLGITTAASGKWDAMVWKVCRDNAVYFANLLLHNQVPVFHGFSEVHISDPENSPGCASIMEKLEDTPTDDLIARRLGRSAGALERWDNAVPYAVIVSILPSALADCGRWLTPLIQNQDETQDTHGVLRPGIHVVGAKWLSQVRLHQARELTPYEVGDDGYRASVSQIQGGSVQLIALYGFDVYSKVKAAVESAFVQRPNSEIFISPTARLSFRQLATFFFDRDVYVDPKMNGAGLAELDLQLRPLVLNLTRKSAPTKTLGIVQATRTSSGIVRIFRTVQRYGLKITSLKLCRLTRDMIAQLRSTSPTSFQQGHSGSLEHQLVWMMALEHVNAVTIWHDLLAENSFNFCSDQQSLVFGSESLIASRVEIPSVLEPAAVAIYPSPAKAMASSILLELNCLVISATALAKLTLADIMDELFTNKLNIVACVMTSISKDQAKELLYNSSGDQLCAHVLTTGSLVALGVEGDNAVTCVDSMLGRGSIGVHYKTSIFAATTKASASAAINMFFS